MERLDSEGCHTIEIKSSLDRRWRWAVAVVIGGSVSFIHSRKRGQTTLAESSVGGNGAIATGWGNGGGGYWVCEEVCGQRGEEVDSLEVGR